MTSGEGRLSRSSRESSLSEPVIRADIAKQAGGSPSHADEVDARMGTPYGRRLATAAYLFSLTRDVPGVAASDLYGAVLAPGDDPNLIVKALDGLENTCWYLHAYMRGYRFSTRGQPRPARPGGRGEDPRQQGPRASHQGPLRAVQGLRTQGAHGLGGREGPGQQRGRIPRRLPLARLRRRPRRRPRRQGPREVIEAYEKSPSGGVREYRNRLPLPGSEQRRARAELKVSGASSRSISYGRPPSCWQA
jgi:hypothetical protein